MTDIERQQKALVQKMNAKMMELEEQIKTLEILLANFEIQHVTGEVDEEVYQREINVLSMGLEASRQELNTIREAVDQLSSGNVIVEEEAEPQPEEKLQKPVVEFAKVVEADSSENKQETLEGTEKSQPTETATEDKEKQEA
jgi:hypothetical protein